MYMFETLNHKKNIRQIHSRKKGTAAITEVLFKCRYFERAKPILKVQPVLLAGSLFLERFQIFL